MEIQAVGGYDGVGRNMTVVRLDGAQLAFDCGIKLDSFLLYYGRTREDFRKIPLKDLVAIGAVPDLSKVKGNIDAFLISHGHLDHMGALEKYIDNYPAQIFSTPYAAGLIRARLNKSQQDKLSPVDYKQNIQVTPRLSAEFVEATHSIPQASMIRLNGSEGDVIYACDYKFDDFSRLARTDYATLKKAGKEGVKALIVESLDVASEWKNNSEAVARAKVREAISFASETSGLLVATTFSTHLERLQTIVDEAKRVGRKVIIAGSSYIPNCSLGERMGLLNLPEDCRVISSRGIDNALAKIKNRKEYLLLVTGHQGEPDSVLARMTDGKLRFKLMRGDSVIFSSRTIPTDVNIANKSQLIDKLCAQGVKVYEDVHVSGHASREEHRKLIKMLNPEHIIPAHGDMNMMASYVPLAEDEGYRLNKDVHLLRNGDELII